MRTISFWRKDRAVLWVKISEVWIPVSPIPNDRIVPNFTRTRRLDVEGDESELRTDDMKCIRESVPFGWKMRVFQIQRTPLLPRTPEFYLGVRWSLMRMKNEECQEHAGNLNIKSLYKKNHVIPMIKIRYTIMDWSDVLHTKIV